MKVLSTFPVVWLTFISMLMLAAAESPERKVYIVYLGFLTQGQGEFTASTHHIRLLQEIGVSAASESLLHSYHRSFNGFVAKLTDDEAKKLDERKDVVSVFPNEKKQLLTRKSWDFMGFSEPVTRSKVEGDVIVGMLDTGIWPDSQSFNDTNFGPPPAKWKGKCQESANFTCNNKIIGARYYRAVGKITSPNVASPIDTLGHGTHTASTAAGDIVQGASMLGLGEGTARGGVPSARLAVYKICWTDGCYDADILAAFDDAIADGVDVISLSVGGSLPLNYTIDPIAIGSFHAMQNGILTSNSAGNSGPKYGTTSSIAPWMLSVAAGTIDRKFVTKVLLGNGKTYEGLSINTFDLEEKMYPLINAGNAGINGSYPWTHARNCDPGTLDENIVKGKIVFCEGTSYEHGAGPAMAGAAGVVLLTAGFGDVAFSFVLPTASLTSKNGSAVFNYLNSTVNATATIYKTITETDEFSPSIVSFSSRGPNLVTHDILKPDITAPGVDILAAWTGDTTATGFPQDNRVVPYNILSGTSMACPHASGAAAYVKSYHPTWSPAAIKSALMTTASSMNPANHQNEFLSGAGHINPAKAINPGLVYDARVIDYVKFLCGQGYSEATVKIIAGNDTSCSTNGTAWDLNYPSFTLSAAIPGEPTTRIFHRTVTNVGSPVSTYKAIVSAPEGLEITVEPSVLTFKSLAERKSFIVNATVTLVKNSTLSGSLTWDDGVRKVRSPVVGYLPRALVR